jgi:hypothetical protein
MPGSDNAVSEWSQPMSTTLVIPPIGQRIDPIITFKDGVAYWWGMGPSQPVTNPEGGKNQDDRGFGSMLYVLLVLHQSLGEYSEEVRAAAGKFAEAACGFLADRYGDGKAGEVKILDPRGNTIVSGGEFC